MRDLPPIAARYAEMHSRYVRAERRKSLGIIAQVAAVVLLAALVMHSFHNLAARVEADLARGAAEYCGAC